MTKLILLRHAPTPWNREKRLQGRTDIPLDEMGIAIASRWQIPSVWQSHFLLVSPLIRARMTAEILFPGKEKRIDPRLIEMDFGAWEGKSLEQLRQAPGAAAEEREKLGLDFRAPEGESPREVQARLLPLLHEIALPGQPTIAVTHKAVIRALYALATDWSMMEKPAHKLKDHCAQIFDIDEKGQIRVQELNHSLIEGE